ncbi:hypothetical protein P3T76_002425 [Phytophthora citrophthora]|uniref:Uncharacterized protein n=1 Tax=Phytophthora citrophthora TaxID=4793 RepID=A0AAD9GZ12_9STRA|nr:hypothetical protein P3T76_002425 [Phytophthora citrophthora]
MNATSSFPNLRVSFDMADRDTELLAVYSFLDDVTLDEIMRYGSDEAPTEIFEVESNCSEVGSLDEPSVTGTTSDEDVGSDNEPYSLKSPFKRKRKQKSEAARVRQRVYDKKCRHKKRTLQHVFRGVFISVLKDFIVLVQFRLLKTEHETKLFCLAKKNGDEMPSGETARHQVELNQGAVESIKNTATDWRKYKNGDTGKWFLKEHAEEIQSLLDNLLELREQLKVATSELLWRLEEKTTGVTLRISSTTLKSGHKSNHSLGLQGDIPQQPDGVLRYHGTMNDTELAAVWDFLNESTIDEILGSGSPTATNAAGFIKSAYDVSVAAFKRNNASPSNSDRTSVENTSADEMQAKPQTLVNVKRSGMSKVQRERQRGYDKKHRLKKTNMRIDAAKTLVAGLKLLNLLLEDRIQRTRRKFPDFDRDLQKINHEAKTQLGLNQAATTYIKLWTATWKLSKIEKGKFFLKTYVKDIEEYLDGLVTLREKLVESTTELESCATQKPIGVWI